MIKNIIKKFDTKRHYATYRAGIWRGPYPYNLPSHDKFHTIIVDESTRGVGLFTSKEKNQNFPEMEVDLVSEDEKINGEKGKQYMTSYQKIREYSPEAQKQLIIREDLQPYMDKNQNTIEKNLEKNKLATKPTIKIKQTPNDE